MNNNPHLNAIRMLGIDQIDRAQSGHPGIVLGATPIIYVLFTEIMNLTPEDPEWFNRDRFILSAGHGSAMLYAMLHLAGYNITKEDLRQFRQLGSITPGHPERSLAHGIEVATGPLGQGIAMGVGMAVAEEYLAAQYNKPDYPLINHFTYVLCGDGDLQEGVAQEAISFAGNQKLQKLILIHDSNDVQLDSMTAKTTNEALHARFAANGWNTIKVEDGEDIFKIRQALKKAQESKAPTYIEVKTIIGRGAKQQGTPNVHGAPLSDLVSTKQFYNWSHEPFVISSETYQFYKRQVKERVHKRYQDWRLMWADYEHHFPKEHKDLELGIKREWKINLTELAKLKPQNAQATRVSSGTIVDFLMKTNRNFIGGSADLSGSTKIKGANGEFSPENRRGQNILYGVREFGMGAINNGIAAHGGLLPIGATFLVFSDYLKPSIRLAALMKLQNLFVFSHDSIAVGEDGPTHQPIEHLTMLRSIPNVNVFRPADFEETLVAYQLAIKATDRPSIIITTRQDLPQQQRSQSLGTISKGGYILNNNPRPKVTLIASGSEVSLAKEVGKCLEKHHVATRLVSMPSTHLFNRQSEKYRQKVIDKNSLRVALEMGSPDSWYRYVGDNGLVVGLEAFGASGKSEAVIKSFGFEAEKICRKIRMKLKEKNDELIG